MSTLREHCAAVLIAYDMAAAESTRLPPDFISAIRRLRAAVHAETEAERVALIGRLTAGDTRPAGEKTAVPLVWSLNKDTDTMTAHAGGKEVASVRPAPIEGMWSVLVDFGRGAVSHMVEASAYKSTFAQIAAVNRFVEGCYRAGKFPECPYCQDCNETVIRPHKCGESRPA